MYFVGIDWADQKHDIAVVDATGEIVVKKMTIPKSRAGFDQLVRKLRQLSDNPQGIKIGIETAHNLLVDYLVDLGYEVHVIFTGSMKSFRKRYRSSGARDDEFDSFVLADVLRTDRACWRKVDFGSELVREIRLLVKDHHALVRRQTALTNTLRATLKDYYPEYLEFFADVACDNSLAFLIAYPDFACAQKLTRDELGEFFKQHKLHNGKTIDKIYRILHQKPLKVPEPLIRVRRQKAIIYARQLLALAPAIDTYTKQIKERLQEHPDAKIFLSYPGVGYVMAARLLAIFGDNRQLYTKAQHVQTLAGTCPVTEKTGGSTKAIYFRRACNKFYRDTMHNLAFCSLRNARWAMVYYQHQRASGKSNSHALRCLANLHLKIIFAMWKNQTLYDENIFLAQRSRQIVAMQKKLLLA